ncbi:LOW QUALITY PROTEIN: transcription factor bHLH71-like [Rutidosis leptorrhynchoides]|uniref:LOW QUALITY PROTEIN: transcription factor bHLH71-like n=1 Tax=Rutidosis leptorrhynchoides TaxID=125765 RepID=UPI003A9A34DB
MAVEALSPNDLMNFILHNTTISTTPMSTNYNINNDSCLEKSAFPVENSTINMRIPENQEQLGIRKKKKRKRKPRVCKNKEEAETERMTHIAVERNRRKLINEHLADLRSLMPESYAHRGDQASIVGGAIEFVKELEHHLQELETQKMKYSLQQQEQEGFIRSPNLTTIRPPFAQFFVYPQYTWSQIPNKHTSKTNLAIADIEVTLVETHANIRILSPKSFRELSKLVSAFQSICLSILHLNVTTFDNLVLYSISAKVEGLNSVDDIANAVHHMLRIIQEEAAFCSSLSIHQ